MLHVLSEVYLCQMLTNSLDSQLIHLIISIHSQLESYFPWPYSCYWVLFMFYFLRFNKEQKTLYNSLYGCGNFTFPSLLYFFLALDIFLELKHSIFRRPPSKWTLGGSPGDLRRAFMPRWTWIIWEVWEG